MFAIKETHFGYWLTFAGHIDGPEMKRWVEESERELAGAPEMFDVFVDMRELRPLAEDAQVHMNAGQRFYKSRGMRRSVVILDSAVLTMQFKRIAKETGIYEWERYLNAQKIADWEEVGMRWLLQGDDPDAE